MLQRALSLRPEQAAAIQEAHGHFLARQRALAAQRCRALPLLQNALYSSCDLATHTYMGCASACPSCPLLISVAAGACQGAVDLAACLLQALCPGLCSMQAM